MDKNRSESNRENSHNTLAITLAPGVLAGYGVILPPAIGALLMSFSTVIVAVNAKLFQI